MATKRGNSFFFHTAQSVVCYSILVRESIINYTDIGRTRTDTFSSAASRLIAPPFFNTSFFIFGERKSRQVSKQRNPYFRRTQQPAGGSPFFRHLRMIFHNSMLYSLNGYEYSPVPSVLSSHCKHGLSVRMVEFLSCFSGGVCPSCVSKLRLIHGGRSRRAFARMIPDSVRARARAYRSPFFRHLFPLIFHKIKIFSRNGRGNIRPFPSVRSSHCKHGLSVRMSQSLLTFSGGVRPAAANGIQGVRPSFLALRAIFHDTLDWMGRTPERLQERFGRSAHFYAYRYENRI